MCPAASSRWCPTPEQVMILEEMYRSGIRTPNAVQIQQITAHLAFYGRIEGKNVFYWFQNHKARDREKLRKKLNKQHLQQQQQQQMFQPCNYNTHNYQHQLFSLENLPNSSGSKLPFPYPATKYSNPPPTNFLPQGGGKRETANRVMMNHGDSSNDNAADVAEERMREMMQSRIMGSKYGRDWMTMKMMMDVGPSAPCCNNNTIINPPKPPLKTLELFPITSSSRFKEESISSLN